jgi:KDO2-lipid IV(A) lauroyltransferase
VKGDSLLVRAVHRLEYGLFVLVSGLLRLLPHHGARALGRLMGRLLYALDRRHRRIATKNLALALPELGDDERRTIARRTFEHVGLATADTVSAGRFDAVELCKRLEIVGWHHLQEAEAEREARGARGTLITTPHFGLWEIAAYAMGLYGGPFHVVGRPLDNPLLDRHLTLSRERFGNRQIPKHGAIRPALKALHAGERVGILIDQRQKPGQGIPVPCFGHDASTTPILARLSLKTGAPVVNIFCVPREGGRYRLEITPAIWPEDVPDGDEGIADLTRRYVAVQEEHIRRRPELWLWLHDRWRGQGS